MVATTDGDVYWGTLAHDDQAADTLTLTTRSGEAVSVARKAVSMQLQAGNAIGIAAESLVTKLCPGTGYASPPVREITLTGGAPFRAEVHRIIPGSYVRVRPLLSTSPERRDLPWADLEQIKHPSDVHDRCLPVQLEDGESRPGAPTGSALGLPGADSQRLPAARLHVEPHRRRGPIMFGVGLGVFAISYLTQVALSQGGPASGYVPIAAPFKTGAQLLSQVQSCHDGDGWCGIGDVVYVIGGVGVIAGGLVQLGGLVVAGTGAGYWATDK